MTQNERLPSSGSSQVLAQDVVSNHGVQLAPLADSGVSIRLRLADIRPMSGHVRPAWSRFSRGLFLYIIHRCRHGFALRNALLNLGRHRAGKLAVDLVTWNPRGGACLSVVAGEFDKARGRGDAGESPGEFQACMAHVLELVVVLPLLWFG